MVRLAIPEDDTTPDTPFQILLQSNVQALRPDLTLSTEALCLCQISRFFGEEQLMAAIRCTSSVFT